MIPIIFFRPGSGGGGGVPATALAWATDGLVWGAGNYMTWG